MVSCSTLASMRLCLRIARERVRATVTCSRGVCGTVPRAVTSRGQEGVLERVSRLELRVDAVSAQLHRKLRDLRATKLTSTAAAAVTLSANPVPQQTTAEGPVPAAVTSSTEPAPAAITPGVESAPAVITATADDLQAESNMAGLKTMQEVPLFDATPQQEARSWPFTPVLQQLVAIRSKPPSVTSVLGQTMSAASRQALRRWEEKMIRKLGVEGFQRYKKDLFASGRNFHECLDAHLQQGTDVSELGLTPANEGVWESVTPLLEHVTDVRLVETRVTHPLLRYVGVIDCVARYRGRLVVIDWKTSNRWKSSLQEAYDDPVQLAAYYGALQHTAEYNLPVDGALLAVCYRDGRQAHALYMSRPQLISYWTLWLRRLHLYWNMMLRDDVSKS